MFKTTLLLAAILASLGFGCSLAAMATAVPATDAECGVLLVKAVDSSGGCLQRTLSGDSSQVPAVATLHWQGQWAYIAVGGGTAWCSRVLHGRRVFKTQDGDFYVEEVSTGSIAWEKQLAAAHVVKYPFVMADGGMKNMKVLKLEVALCGSRLLHQVRDWQDSMHYSPMHD